MTDTYYCPLCGAAFLLTEGEAANAHARQGSLVCVVPRDTPTPDGFHWDCASCGVVTVTLKHALLHKRSRCPNEGPPYRRSGLDEWECCGRQVPQHEPTCWYAPR